MVCCGSADAPGARESPYAASAVFTTTGGTRVIGVQRVVSQLLCAKMDTLSTVDSALVHGAETAGQHRSIASSCLPRSCQPTQCIATDSDCTSACNDDGRCSDADAVSVAMVTAESSVMGTSEVAIEQASADNPTTRQGSESSGGRPEYLNSRATVPSCLNGEIGPNSPRRSSCELSPGAKVTPRIHVEEIFAKKSDTIHGNAAPDRPGSGADREWEQSNGCPAHGQTCARIGKITTMRSDSSVCAMDEVRMRRATDSERSAEGQRQSPQSQHVDGNAWETFVSLSSDQSRWLAAEQLLCQIELVCGCNRLELATMHPERAHVLEEHETRLTHLRLLEAALADDGGYSVSGQGPLQVMYRRDGAGGALVNPVHRFRFVADFPDASAVEVLALVREFDLAATWNWAFTESALMRERTDMDIDARAVLRMPWPFVRRAAAMRAVGGDLLRDSGSAVILFHSTDQLTAEAFPASATGVDPVTILEGSGARLEPRIATVGGTSREGCRVTVQLNIDPHMRAVPAALINFVLKVISPVVYRLAKHVITSTLRRVGTKLHARVWERRAFYASVHAKVLDFLQTMPQPGVEALRSFAWHAPTGDGEQAGEMKAKRTGSSVLD